jgi:hypothetical protein
VDFDASLFGKGDRGTAGVLQELHLRLVAFVVTGSGSLGKKNNSVRRALTTRKEMSNN